MEVAAERVDPLHVAREKRRTLGVREIESRERAFRVDVEARPERPVLLQAVQEAVHCVSTHPTLHSTAARLIRPSWPKSRTSARAGVAAPISAIQFRNSCSPALSISPALRDRRGSPPP